MTTTVRYDERANLEELLRTQPGLDCMDSILFDELLNNLLEAGIKYPPLRPGQTCYYLAQQEEPNEDGIKELFVAASEVKQLTFNDFGDWLLLTDTALVPFGDYGVDIFGSQALAQTICDKRNALINPDATEEGL